MTTAAKVSFRKFSDALHSALTREEVVQAYFDVVSSVIDATAVGIYELDPADQSLLELQSPAAGEWLDRYEEFGRQDDPVLQFAIGQQRPIDSSRVVRPTSWEQCGARQALRLEGLAHSLEAPLLVSGLPFGTINFARPADAPRFSTTDLVIARTVSEQLGLATERALRFEATGRRATVLEQALDRMSQAVVVTDLDGQVLFQNRVARREWDLDVDSEGFPVPSGVGDSITQAMAEFRHAGKRLFVSAVESTTSKKRAVVKSYRLSEKDSTAVTLLFPYSDGEKKQLPVWDVLTRREQEIAQLVSEGLTTKEIAARAFISENTVKQHLKRVFAKTDVSTRAELVQLIWTAGDSGDPTS